jgi:hypothetical protein
MEQLICENSQPAYEALINALKKLLDNRIKDGSFRDQEEAVEKAYFSTLEGLEALLIPLVNLQKNTILNQKGRDSALFIYLNLNNYCK